MDLFKRKSHQEEEKKQSFTARFFQQETEKEKPKEADDIIKDDFIKGSACGPEGCSLIIESMQAGVEANYFWVLNFLKTKNVFGLSYKNVYKIRDTYTAGEASSLWGSQEQRKGIQQDKVSQYMATIGKMIKDTFQVIRELRIIDERLEYYDGYNKGHSDAATALKGTWIDLVEGGVKNPASVFGLSSQVGFVTLPDLFFIANPKTKEDIRKEVAKFKGQGINRKVREVLERKLFQFIVWKEKTEKEIRTRKSFVLSYLRMHFNNINLYIQWVKPYLKAVNQLQSGSSAGNPYVSSTFETAQTELELLAQGETYNIITEEGFEEEFTFRKYFPCVIIKFNHVALPQMSFQKEYQRGPIHSGRTEIKILPYVLTQEQINQYKAARDRKAFEEIEGLIPSLEDSLRSIGDELEKYLKEAEGIKEEKQEKQESDTVFTPFKSIWTGVKEIFSKGKKETARGPLPKKKESIEKNAASSTAALHAFLVYEIYKKTHGMLAP